jgi:hypothetical protein
VAARRVLSISLPASDPTTAAIWAWLDGLPADVDVSSEARRLLADAIRLDARLAGIEAQLARLHSAGATGAAPALTAEQSAVLDVILDFGG